MKNLLEPYSCLTELSLIGEIKYLHEKKNYSLLSFPLVSFCGLIFFVFSFLVMAGSVLMVDTFLFLLPYLLRGCFHLGYTDVTTVSGDQLDPHHPSICEFHVSRT